MLVITKKIPSPLLWWSGFFTLVLLLPVASGLLAFYVSLISETFRSFFCYYLFHFSAPLIAFMQTWLAGRLAYAAARAPFAADAWRWTVLALLYSQVAYWVWGGPFWFWGKSGNLVFFLTLCFLGLCAFLAFFLLKKIAKASPSGSFMRWLIISLFVGATQVHWLLAYIIGVCYSR